MAFGYRRVDRDQLFLLPPDVREWLPEDHLVWLIVDVVERIDTSRLHERHPNDGVGRRAYDPDMLLALLLYAYCTGQRSSRKIERLCEVDVAYRVICANDAPDHTTIARFRQVHQEHAEALFVEVLLLCKQAGLTTVGVVAVDGTKIAADASIKASRSEEHINAEVAAMMAEANAVDTAEDAEFGDRRGDELPKDLATRQDRRRRLDAALEQLKAKRKRREANDSMRRAVIRRAVRDGHGFPPPSKDDDPVAHAEARVEYYRRRAAKRRAEAEARARARGRRPSGFAPRGDDHEVKRALRRLDKIRAEQAAKASSETATSDKVDRANTTDPDSRVMPTAKGGWVQGYNAQAAVNQHGVVLAATVTNIGSDSTQCRPMMKMTRTNLNKIGERRRIGMMLFDAGYWSDKNATTRGPRRLIATTKSYKLRQQLKERGATSGPPPPDATPAEAMEHRLRTPEGTALYKQRQHTVEPVFGDIKHNRQIQRFMHRGLVAVTAEWRLIATTHNLLKLSTVGLPPT
ncbi:transposase [Desertimonas flava]|uniref:transposase n=1 Tax=Desertimonas flava TaxID=2064846 RepID=UPI000E348E45|nr:transposase [Desertimonas flava]